MIIPTEYIGYDFGFSGVDAPPTELRDTPIVNPEVENKLDGLHKKIDDLMSIITSSDMSVAVKLKDDIRQLEIIIVPLLNNLLKTKDKEYIFWPNRGPLIEKQLERVLEITRGT